MLCDHTRTSTKTVLKFSLKPNTRNNLRTVVPYNLSNLNILIPNAHLMTRIFRYPSSSPLQSVFSQSSWINDHPDRFHTQKHHFKKKIKRTNDEKEY